MVEYYKSSSKPVVLNSSPVTPRKLPCPLKRNYFKSGRASNFQLPRFCRWYPVSLQPRFSQGFVGIPQFGPAISGPVPPSNFWCLFSWTQADASRVASSRASSGQPKWLRVLTHLSPVGGGYIGEYTTVDGSKIRRSPVDIVNIPLFTGFLYIPGGCLGFLPSTICTHMYSIL